MKTSMSPTQHERSEWIRYAEALEQRGRIEFAALYRQAAARPSCYDFGVMEYDALMDSYRTWLCFGFPNAHVAAGLCESIDGTIYDLGHSAFTIA